MFLVAGGSSFSGRKPHQPESQEMEIIDRGRGSTDGCSTGPLLSLVLRAAYRPNFFSVWLAIGLATLVLQTKLLTE